MFVCYLTEMCDFMYDLIYCKQRLIRYARVKSIYTHNKSVRKYNGTHYWSKVTCPNCLSLGKPVTYKNKDISFVCKALYVAEKFSFDSKDKTYTSIILCKSSKQKYLRTNKTFEVIPKYKTTIIDNDVTCPDCLSLLSLK